MGENINPLKPLDGWELRCRFVVALAWILGIGVMRQPVTIIVSGVVLLILLVGMVVPLRQMMRNVLVVFPFLLISFITLLFSDGIPVTQESLDFALLISLRMVACVLAVALVSGNDVQDYLNVFRAMKFPHVLTSTLFLTQRYVHVIARQLSSTRKALVSRLFSPRLRLKTFKIYGQIIGGMTIYAIDRSDHVRKAMESRGFRGQMRIGRAMSIRWHDVLKSAAVLLLLAAILLVEKWWQT